MSWELAINVRESEHGNEVRKIANFENVEIQSKYDSVASTFAVSFLYDASNQNHAEIAGVSHYHEAIISYIHEDGSKELVLTGYILSQKFTTKAEIELVSIGGYSKCGVIEDCDIPPSVYPLEFEGLTFAQIARKIINPFAGKKGFSLIIGTGRANQDVKTPEEIALEKAADDDEYEKSTAPESKNIKSYLTDLAKQKNIVLSHTRKGDLIISVANTESKPFLELDLDKPSFGVISATMMFNGQPMHSHITMIRQADDEGGNAAEFTIRNPLCPVVYRPKVEQLTSGDDITIEDSARNLLCEELKAITLTIEFSQIAFNNKLIAINNIIVVKSRKNYLYKKVRWFIESVNISADASKQVATVTCVLPWTYNYFAKGENGKKGPQNVFIDPHKNLPSEVS